MTVTTSVPAVQFTAAGVLLPLESAILAGVQTDINSAFGGGVNPGLNTPQGQLAQSLTAIIGEKNDEIAAISNNINPDTAAGRWQDAIGRIYFLDRIAASGTVVTATCTGLVGTVIQAGVYATDTAGNQYINTAAVTIGSTGSVQAQFQNVVTGPIPCAAGTLNTIYTAQFGWESITNAAAGTLGSDVETRADFEQRRKNSVALNAVNTVQSMYAAVLALPNVIDAVVRDNPQGIESYYGSTAYPMAPHSVTVSVAGGSSASIAPVIWAKKAPGCAWNGNTSAAVQDTINYTSAPYPTYNVTYLVPTATTAYFSVQIVNNPSLPANIIALIQSAIIAAFTGADGGQMARIDSTIYSGRYFAGVAATNPNVQVLSIGMGFTALTAANTKLSFGIDQLPSISASNIAVMMV